MINRIMTKINYLFNQYVIERLYGNYIMPAFYNLYYKVEKKEQMDIGKSVLIWNIDSLGDSTWITPVLKSLINHCEELRITLVCNKICLPVFENYSDRINLIGIDPTPFYSPLGVGKIPEELSEKKQFYDSILILEMGSRPSDVGRIIGHKLKIRNIASINLGLLKSTCHYVVKENTEVSAEYWPKNFLRILEPFHVEREESQIDLLYKEVQAENYVLIHPVVAGYGMATKMLPLKKLRVIIDFILKNSDREIVFSCGPDEGHYLEEFSDLFKNERVKDLREKLSVKELLELINRASLVICNDTSVLHFATGMKKNVVTFFGATNERKIADIEKDYVHVFSSSRKCRSCHKNNDRYPYWPKCIYKRAECLYDISEDEVSLKLGTLL